MNEPTGGPFVATMKFPSGVDNRSREYSVPDGCARSLVNLDVTRDGGLRCRDGARKVMSGNFHSLYTPKNGRYSLLVRDGYLCRMDARETVSVLTSVSGPVVYAELNNEVFWSDREQAGRVSSDGTLGVWGLSTPPQPQLTVVDGYALFPGTYQVAMTAVQLATGLESGAAEPAQITLSVTGGIQVAAPTASADFKFRVYLSPVYGGQGEFRHAVTLSPGATAILATGTPDGPRLQSMLAVKPYPATRLTVFKGRIWIASGSSVWYTSERSPHWLFPEDGYFQFDSAVNMMGLTEDGIYVGLSDRVYFLQGTKPRDMTQRVVSNIGAIAGDSNLPFDAFITGGIPPAQQCIWWDTDGVQCVGRPDGVILRPNGDRYAAGTAATTTNSYRVSNGIRQLVSVLRADNPIVGAFQAVDC